MISNQTLLASVVQTYYDVACSENHQVSGQSYANTLDALKTPYDWAAGLLEATLRITYPDIDMEFLRDMVSDNMPDFPDELFVQRQWLLERIGRTESPAEEWQLRAELSVLGTTY